jgi:hypothetical protein
MHVLTTMAASYHNIVLGQATSRTNATKRVLDALEQGLADEIALL